MKDWWLRMEKDVLNKFPNSWTRSCLGEIAIYLNGRAFKSSEWETNGLPIVRIQNLNKPTSKYNYTSKDFEERYKIKNGDLLFAWSASLGVYLWKEEDAWLNQHIFKVIPNIGIDKKFLYFYLNNIVNKLYSQTHGSGMVHITKKKLEATEIFIPPLSEQNRIVIKIEELFSELDKGIENLKTLQQQLRVYRQAVLQRAFEGKLTEKWRNEQINLSTAKELLEEIRNSREQKAKENRKKLKPITSLTENELEEFPNLPIEWSWGKLDDLLSIDKRGMTTGPFGTALKKSEHKNIGVPVLGIENIGRGKFVNQNKIFVTKEKAEELSSFNVNAGDIIISRSGTVGELCIVPESILPALISTNLIRVSLNKDAIHPKYFVYLFLGEGAVRKQIKELCKGSTREFLNQSILKSLIFPIAPIIEQQAIINQIESRFSICDKLEETIEQSLQKTDALRQSILKKAFEGKLVPQDPNDEPAELLLEKIKAKKEEKSQKPAKKTNKRGKTSEQLSIF